MTSVKHYTSISQSKKLLELGMNPESADMHYILIGDIDSGNIICSDICPLEVGKPYNKLTLPCWSLGALLDIIPHTSFDGIELNNYNDGKTIWTAIFHWKTDSTSIRIADTPLDAVYEVIVHLLENGYIKKESSN